MTAAIDITPTISIPGHELHMEFIRASGPGGQNVNKVSSAVQLRFDVTASPSLAEDVKVRLKTLAGSRMTRDGVLIIDARRHRAQAANRDDAVERLVELVRQAARRPRVRRKTAPTAGSRKRRMESKRRRGQTKQLRAKPIQREE